MAEVASHVVGFEVETFDFVVVTAAFNGGPIDDAGRGGTERIAHVRLLVDFFRAGAGAAVGKELDAGKFGAFGAVDDLDDAQLDGVFHGDAEVEVPGGIGGIYDF